jgi:hypothetical protein
MTKVRDKLTKLNVPELFYARFVANIPLGTTTIVDVLHNTTPTARGRGLTRVIENLTEEQYNDVYQLAAIGRAAIKKKEATDAKKHRVDTLFPAICAKTLADRMEKAGVANPVAYIAKKTTRRTKAVIEAARAAEADLKNADMIRIESVVVGEPQAIKVPVEPPTLDRVNIPESTPSEQLAFREDMKLGNS